QGKKSHIHAHGKKAVQIAAYRPETDHRIRVNLEIQGIEKLTHDSYVVQIPRIQPRLQSRLEMLLTIFEQNNFVDDREITKNYTYPVDDEYIKYIVEILHHTGTDPIFRVGSDRPAI
ncbi:MAG: hypothetical protein ABFD82_14145, partial [Syntrophaceae bacterium]